MPIDIKAILSEARRGRPRKEAPSHDDEGGREHIVVQLRKAENLRGEKHVEFNDSSKHKLPLEHVKKALNMHQGMKPIQKGEFEKRLAHSHASFMSAVKGEAAPASKPKVSLGSMKREEVEHIEEGFDDYSELAKHLVNRYGKNVTDKHIDSLEQDRDSRSSLDRKELWNHIKKHQNKITKEETNPKPKLYSDTIKQASKDAANRSPGSTPAWLKKALADKKTTTKEGWVHIGPPGGKSPYDRTGDIRPGTITLGREKDKWKNAPQEEPINATKTKVVNDRLTTKKEQFIIGPSTSIMQTPTSTQITTKPVDRKKNLRKEGLEEAKLDINNPMDPGTGADPITKRSDRGNYKTYIQIGVDGRTKLVKHREHRKDIKVESVSVNMQQDSLNKLKKEPLANKKEIKDLPPTQGNKPIGGEDQTHTGKFSVAEKELLNNLYNSLNEENKIKFDKLAETEEGIARLVEFALEQGM